MSADKRENTNTGSSNQDEPVFVVIGKFRRPHGIRGEIVMTVLTDFPDLMKPGQQIYVGMKYHPYQIKTIRAHGSDLLISLEDLPDRTAVEVFRNVMVYMHAEHMPDLPEGDYYSHQLVGLDVFTDENQHLGKVKEILITGANDVYLVEDAQGKEILLPAIEQVILEINQEESRILVHILPGLIDP
jgi:16S rRNA processing protein RimM